MGVIFDVGGSKKPSKKISGMSNIEFLVARVMDYLEESSDERRNIVSLKSDLERAKETLQENVNSLTEFKDELNDEAKSNRNSYGAKLTAKRYADVIDKDVAESKKYLK